MLSKPVNIIIPSTEQQDLSPIINMLNNLSSSQSTSITNINNMSNNVTAIKNVTDNLDSKFANMSDLITQKIEEISTIISTVKSGGIAKPMVSDVDMNLGIDYAANKKIRRNEIYECKANRFIYIRNDINSDIEETITLYYNNEPTVITYKGYTKILLIDISLIGLLSAGNFQNTYQKVEVDKLIIVPDMGKASIVLSQTRDDIMVL